MNLPNGVLRWDIEQITNSLNISPMDVRDYFTDGRRVSFILERRIAKEIMKGTLSPSEGAGFDIIDSKGDKWEARSISRGGVYFCPSYMVGSGRKFNEQGFVQKLNDIRGYVLADIESFPDVPFWIIEAEQVRAWWNDGVLGKSTKVSRKKIIELIDKLGI